MQAETPHLVMLHAQLVMLTFMALGWSFRFEKCNLIPSQKITHLGFEINTVAMTISCPKEKIGDRTSVELLYLTRKLQFDREVTK